MWTENNKNPSDYVGTSNLATNLFWNKITFEIYICTNTFYEYYSSTNTLYSITFPIKTRSDQLYRIKSCSCTTSDRNFKWDQWQYKKKKLQKNNTFILYYNIQIITGLLPLPFSFPSRLNEHWLLLWIVNVICYLWYVEVYSIVVSVRHVEFLVNVESITCTGIETQTK